MSQSAFIKLVQGSAVSELPLEELKEKLIHYREQTALTGTQLDWDYAKAAFPYTFESKQDDRWFYLQGTNPGYKYIVFGNGDEGPSTIQVVLPDGSTHGDKAKANELCKYLAKQLLAELTMFNGRTIYYNPRK
ncbi:MULTISPECIES: DUF1885 family protein [Paenibacillus]|uniref:DUF1885 family protein n=1 Tax=Paenibacillus glycanilyticus TaxID=126569 RepID=A0ABQ6NF33_9BACL|nr:MULTISPECIES: DUF1885 family protein [Paenibacillus]MCK9859758.1 DUF1885 family protein [Paenibacillus sp. ATY16]GMK43054.1 hypothetical protein PghCCS26_01810 [Paenibacillus glycanilyticus]